MTKKQKGDAGEQIVGSLLESRGYKVKHIGGNFPVVDLSVGAASSEFRVSVKCSLYQDRIRLGGRRSLDQLRSDDFLFALFPPLNEDEIEFKEGGFRLLIIPGYHARKDGLHVHDTYSGSKGYSVMIKGYSKRLEQIDVWTRWWADYLSAWNLLPEARPI